MSIAIPNTSQPIPLGFPTTIQNGLSALEALLRRRKGVDVWNMDDVITWLREIGLWSEKTEREASHKSQSAINLFCPLQPDLVLFAECPQFSPFEKLEGCGRVTKSDSRA